jgi:NADH pyrophosphatase NudC (nudix superfamily)
MAFLDKVSDLGKNAMKKSGEAVETAKITLKINEVKSKIKDAEIELGKYYYSQYQSGIQLDNAAADICVKMKSMYDEIEELQQSRQEGAEKVTTSDSAVKFCPNCGAKLSGEAKFCGGCGGKVED